MTLDPFSAAKLKVWERLTEAVVVISLVGAGLKINSRHLLLAPPVRRLLLVAMPLCIAAVALLAWGLAGLPISAALLLGAVLAPTDPVLAGDLQVDGPGKGDTPRRALHPHGRSRPERRLGLPVRLPSHCRGLAGPGRPVLAGLVAAAGRALPDRRRCSGRGRRRLAAGTAGLLRPARPAGGQYRARLRRLVRIPDRLRGGRTRRRLRLHRRLRLRRGAARCCPRPRLQRRAVRVRRGGRARGDGVGPVPPGRGGAPGAAAT